MSRCRRLVAWLLLSLAAVAPALAEPMKPGDVLTVVLPGEDSLNKDFMIGRDGRLQLPEAGDVEAAGAEPAVVAARIRDRLATVYRDISRLEVKPKERRLLLTVLGFVKTPGQIELPPAGTVQMALNAAGGLVQGAQLDRLQLRRGKEMTSFDYKKYLDSGDDSKIPPLQPLDVIFVPASPLMGNVQVDFDARTLTASGDAAEDRTAVRVFGEVNNPGTFAFKPGTTAIDLLMRAGGVTRYAQVEQIRLISDGEPTLFNLKEFLDSGRRALLPDVKPAMTIFVPKEVDQVKSGARTVYVMGEVFKPGAFEMNPGAGFLDLLANAGGPTRFAETRKVRVLRNGGVVERFDLAAYTEQPGAAKPPSLRPGDAIFVPEKTDANEKSWLKIPPDQAIKVMGAVKSPGRYEYSNEMSLLDVLAHAGGPTEKGDTARVQVIATAAGSAKPIEFNLQRFLDKGGALSEIPVLRAGFTIVVPELPNDPKDNKSQWIKQSSDRSIYVMGQVKSPGRYAFEESFSFLDILAAADGPVAGADLRNIRVSHRDGAARVSRVDLALYMRTGDERLLPSLKPQDVIFVPEKGQAGMEDDEDGTVRVLGSVARPGRYRFDESMTILDLITEAGGAASDAYQEKIVVVNMSAAGNQARSFNLPEFARSGDLAMLPLVRGGDVVYVPNMQQSNWKIFMDDVRDALTVLSIFAILGRL